MSQNINTRIQTHSGLLSLAVAISIVGCMLSSSVQLVALGGKPPDKAKIVEKKIVANDVEMVVQFPKRP